MTLGLLTLSVAACSSGGRATGSSATGSIARTTRVPQPVRAAVGTMQHAANFAFAATVVTSGGTTHLTGQFEAPDREDLQLKAPNGTTSEVLFVGAKAYQKAPDGSWRDALGGTPRPSDPRSAFHALLEARYGPSRAGAYPCTMSPAVATAIVKGGLPANDLTCSVTIRGNTVAALRLTADRFHAEVVYSGVGSTPALPRP